MQSHVYSTGYFKKCAYLILYEGVMYNIMHLYGDHDDDGSLFLYNVGASALYSGLVLVTHNSICAALSELLKDGPNDTEETKEQRKALWLYVEIMHDNMPPDQLYEDPKKCIGFFKKLLSQIGLSFVRARRVTISSGGGGGSGVHPYKYELKKPSDMLALALCTKPHRNELLQVMSYIHHAPTAIPEDCDIVNEAIETFTDACEHVHVEPDMLL